MPDRPGAALVAVEQLTPTGFPSGAARFDKYAAPVFDGGGRLWVAFTASRGGRDVILARRRDAGGWSAEVRLDAGEGIEGSPRLAEDTDGGLVAVWHGRRRDGWAVYASRFDGRSWGPERRLSPAGEDALHPAIAADRGGRLWLAWQAATRDGFAVRVVAEATVPASVARPAAHVGPTHEARSTGAGHAWGAPATLASGHVDARPALAPRAEGGVWLAWESNRTGNFDIWLVAFTARGADAPAPGMLRQVTADVGFDDAPSLATAPDGALWVAWNSMRSHHDAPTRVLRHTGEAVVRVLKGGRWYAPRGVAPGTLPGQVSVGTPDHGPADAEAPFWHWPQTQNYPGVWVDGAGRAWVIWRTDATGAHNFDLWARVWERGRWSPELHLTDFSPGRDEWPAAALAPDGSLQLAWEGQELPPPGQEARFAGGDVDAYNTLKNANVILTGRLRAPTAGWRPAPLTPVGPDRHDAALADAALEDPAIPGPAARGVATADGRWRVYFGDLHSHTILSDAKTGLPEELYWLFRDRAGLDFAAVTDHAEMGQLQRHEFAENVLVAQRFTTARFVGLWGFEWTADPRFGHRIVLLPGDSSAPLSFGDPSGNDVEKLYAYLRNEGGVTSTHHTGQALWGRWNPAAPHDVAAEPNFELSSWHGRFEFYGNPHEGRRQVPGHQYQDALRAGHRVGVLGSSDAHFMNVGEGGLTAVLADRLDRAAIFDALRHRRTYATSGPRILLDVTANGAPVGSEIASDSGVVLAVRVEGTAPIDRVEIVRDVRDTWALVRTTQSGAGGTFLLYDPAEPQGGRSLAATDLRRATFTVRDAPRGGETSYYVRVTQTDGHQAWSSPIWVARRR